MNVVVGAKHCVVVRGNPGDEDEKRRRQIAEDQAVDSFGRWHRSISADLILGRSSVGIEVRSLEVNLSLACSTELEIPYRLFYLCID